MASSSWERVKTRPGWRAIAVTSWNSVEVSSTRLPAMISSIRGRSTSTSLPTRKWSGPAAAASARRSTARTRATSSLGLKGLVR